MNDRPTSDRTEWQNEPVVDMPAERQGLDLWGILLRRKWLLVFGAVVGLGLGYLHFSRQPAVFQSSARILIVQKRQPVPIQGIDGRSGQDPMLATQSLVIQSPLIVGRAVQEKNLGALRSFAGSGNAAAAINGGLTVSPVEESSANVLELSFRGPEPRDCATVLNAVLETYQDFLGDTHQNIGRETVELITEAKDVLLKQLSAKEAAYREFREQAPLLWKGGEGTNIHQARLAQVEGARSGVLLTRSQTKASLQAIEAARDRGDNREAVLLMIGQAGASSASATPGSSLAQELFPLLLDEQMLLEKYGPDHPQVKTVRKRIELTRQFRQGAAVEAVQSGEEATKPVDFLTVYLQSLREELKASEEQEKELSALFEKEQADAKALVVYEVKDGTYRSDIQRTQQVFEAVIKRLEEINIVKDYGGYTMQVLSPAGGGWQVEPNLYRIMMMAGMLGLLGGCGLAYLVDIADKTFHSPADICHHLRLPLVGHIPLIDTKKQDASLLSELDAILCTHHRPKSQLSEAYRAVRTALYFTTRGEGHKVIQITSPTPGDGKTTLAGNLAVSIAQSGKKVLLLDADFRRPNIHKLFAQAGEVGLASVIEGQAEPHEAVQQSTAVENLWIMTCGPRPHNPSELLTSPQFKELLDVLREQFDFVIIDTPPLLVVTDPSAVAARVDGVLLVLQIKKNVRLSAIRATEMLSTLGAEVLGVVVNGVGARRGYGYGYGRYRFGRYRYGYGYGYGSSYYRYGYGYGYGYYGKGYGSEYGKYYTDDAAKGASANGETGDTVDEKRKGRAR